MPPKPIRPNRPDETFSLKETSPELGGRHRHLSIGGERLTAAFDLVEQMQYLYVRVAKARDLPNKKNIAEESDGVACDPFVEVKLGNYKVSTKCLEKMSNPEWNQVFAFSKDRIQASVLEIVVRDKEFENGEERVGRVWFDVNEVPHRVPPDSALAPQWYKLEDRNGVKAKGELMLSVWMGSQADEAFPDAWHLEAAAIVSTEGIASIRSKVYLSPKLWYVRVNIIEALELVPNHKNRIPEPYVKGILGNLILRSRITPQKSVNPMWNEDLMFVAAEPFDEPLVLIVEDKLGPNEQEILGKCTIPLQCVERRLDNHSVRSTWYNLEKKQDCKEEKKEEKFPSRIHLRISLDGGYHVLDESTYYSSDFRPTSKQLWKTPSIGVLELGILSASGLLPMKSKHGHQTTDAYCVAKYGQKWVRTRTILDSFVPKWNEQYTWEVFDPCTVITIGVFDNCCLENAAGGKDPRIGKVRIRLSTLETDRIYTHSYPLLVLQSSGVKKMGEIQLAVRFSCVSLLNMLQIYSQPMLPKMHYELPLSVYQQDSLRHQASQIVSLRLSRAEPPLRKEVVEYMLDVGSHIWSLRKGRANLERISRTLNFLVAICRLFEWICSWKSPIATVIIHIIFLILVASPELILPAICFYLFFLGILHYRKRPRHPPHMDTKLSHADVVSIEDLEEEFDTFPSSKNVDALKRRYDRLRGIAGRMQAVLGDLAAQGERLQSLLSWRDPRATALCLMFCLISGIVFYVVPFRAVVVLGGFYVLRHPRFRFNVPSVPQNFLKRLPAKTDSML